MRRWFYILLFFFATGSVCFAQEISTRTSEILLDFKKTNPAVVGLPLIAWKSPLAENATSPFPSFIVEAFVSSDVELKSATLIFRNGNVVIGEKSHDVKGVKEKRIRQKLTLNEGKNLIEILVEDVNGNKTSSTRMLTLGEYKFEPRLAANAPAIQVKRIELANDKLNLYYDLTDSLNTNTYTLSLYSSNDGFVSKQEKVTGDIGLEMRPAANYKVTWNAKEVLGSDFTGKVRLELRAKLFVPFVQVEALKKSYKRGKDFSITWKGDSAVAVLDFDLYKGGKLIYPFANIANNGKTTLRVPSSVKPGKGYYFKISNAANKDQVVQSKSFAIKRKTPVLVKVLPIALIGGAAAALGGGGGSGGSHNIPDPFAPTIIH